MILNQEVLFQKTLESIKEKPTEQNMFNAFLTLYPTEWKQLKITFSKFNRSKQSGKSIPLPKPEVSIRKDIRAWLKKQS
ncbi:hypothetical protein PI23P_01907 [Polaribacter irgensii 23-P]|uniref:Uncharacterized protein n=1 Tax=Polaribacter irgensii 23-P TaxID=313594 RepID=A4BW68_9FLAO|nr:hypothetical protein [Polaribacter irgensii]EAR13209.1 hypothetical protein PI23P_01907 [Polaribacter irgensii 23-P]